MSLPTTLWLLLSFRTSVLAWQWEFGSGPVQCGELNMDIVPEPLANGTYSHNSAPYKLLFVPTTKNTPVANVFEMDFPGPDGSFGYGIQLAYPVYTPFLVVGSDNAGFGTGHQRRSHCQLWRQYFVHHLQRTLV